MTGEKPPEPRAPPEAPPAPLEPADQVAAAEGFEAPSMVMDQDELDATITVNVESVFKEILLVKILGSIWFILAGIMVFLMGILGILIFSGGLADFVGNILMMWVSTFVAIVGIVLGILGFFVRATRKWMLYIAPAVLIAAVAIGPLTSTIGSLNTMDIIFSLLFAMFWFMGVEYLHALTRFVEVGEMAIKRRLTNFNLSGVVMHFLGYGFLMLGIIVLVTLGVIGIVPLMTSASNTFFAMGAVVLALGVVGSLFMAINKQMFGAAIYGTFISLGGAILIILGFFILAAGFFTGETDLFANSAELYSVFGIAIAAAIVFTLLALVLTLYYTFAEGIAKVEKVEYSREKLQEMLASGQVLDLDETSFAGGENP